MGINYTSGFCKSCEERRKLFRKGSNHVLHLILTLLTVGLWAIVWLGVSIKFGGWRCDTCGSSAVTTE